MPEQERQPYQHIVKEEEHAARLMFYTSIEGANIELAGIMGEKLGLTREEIGKLFIEAHPQHSYILNHWRQNGHS